MLTIGTINASSIVQQMRITNALGQSISINSVAVCTLFSYINESTFTTKNF